MVFVPLCTSFHPLSLSPILFTQIQPRASLWWTTYIQNQEFSWLWFVILHHRQRKHIHTSTKSTPPKTWQMWLLSNGAHKSISKHQLHLHNQHFKFTHHIRYIYINFGETRHFTRVRAHWSHFQVKIQFEYQIVYSLFCFIKRNACECMRVCVVWRNRLHFHFDLKIAWKPQNGTNVFKIRNKNVRQNP